MSSVINLDCKANELHNPYVADAGFLPSIGAVRSMLTIIANSL